MKGSRVGIVDKNITTQSPGSIQVVRKAFEIQGRLGTNPISEVKLNRGCRDEIIPILSGLQFIYNDAQLRDKLISLVAGDINERTSCDVGRPGMDHWQVVVLAAVRLGCNFDYDKLQDMTENHKSLRGIMGLGDWDEEVGFGHRRIRDTLSALKPSTIEKMNEAIVNAGQSIHGEASDYVRADSFVIETNIHYPTESSLIWDGLRTFIPLCVELSRISGVDGWRQAKHLLKSFKKTVQKISRISSNKGKKNTQALTTAYTQLIQNAEYLLKRAKTLVKSVLDDAPSDDEISRCAAISHWIELTERVIDTATRRVIKGEKVPNSDKLFSLFETHTQLYRRGKASSPNQYGRLVLVFEDGAGFISHYHLLDRMAGDAEVVVAQTQAAQKKHRGKIERASFDRGFHSPENEKALLEIVSEPLVLPRDPKQYASRLKAGKVGFHKQRLHHSGVESAIGALQRGNGLKRCRDRSEIGFERYFGLAILGRNVHTLGKVLLSKNEDSSSASFSKRKVA
jgi:hypothetical protein